MSRKIIGVTVGTQLPKPNFKQNDPTKGDYIKNKPDFEGLKSKVDDIGELVGNTSVDGRISAALKDYTYTKTEIDNGIGAINTAIGSRLNNKADLVNGKIPVSQIPDDINLDNYYTKEEVDSAIAENASDITLDAYPTQGSKNPVESSGIHIALTALENKITSTFCYKGTKANYSDLPVTGNVVGDVWNILNADEVNEIKSGDNVAWDGTKWDVLAGMVDMSGYYTKAEIDSFALGGEINLSDYYTKEEVYTKSEVDSALGSQVESWNDLEDRPFYDARQISFFSQAETPNPVSFSNSMIQYTFYKISDLVPTREQIFGNMTIIDNNGDNEAPREIDIVIETNEFIMTADTFAFLFVNVDGTVNFTYSGYPMSVDVPEAGIYYGRPLNAGIPEGRSFKITIDNISKSHYSYEENPNPPSFVQADLGRTFYKISPLIPTREELLGQVKISTYYGEQILSESDVQLESEDFIYLVHKFPGTATSGGDCWYQLFVAYQDGHLSAPHPEYPNYNVTADVPAKGIYVGLMTGSSMQTKEFFDIEYGATGLKQIDPKFIPVNIDTNLDGYYTKDEVDAALDNVSVDLSGYYTKSEVYSKSEVDSIIGDIDVILNEISTLIGE